MYCIEAKKVQAESGRRKVVFRGSSSDESGVGELQRLDDETPEWADAVLAIKFDHRELIVLNVRHLLSALGVVDAPVPGMVGVHEARLTDAGNVSMRKPTLDSHRSATAAPADAVVLADRLSLPYALKDD